MEQQVGKWLPLPPWLLTRGRPIIRRTMIRDANITYPAIRRLRIIHIPLTPEECQYHEVPTGTEVWGWKGWIPCDEL